MLKSTDSERLSNLEGLKENTIISLRKRNRIDFVGILGKGLGRGGIRWRGRRETILEEMTLYGEAFQGMLKTWHTELNDWTCRVSQESGTSRCLT